MKKSKDSTLRWIIKVTGKTRVGVAFLTFFNCGMSVCAVVFALMLRNVIDAASSGNRGLFFEYTLLFIGIIFLQITLRACIRKTDELVKSGTENVLKKRMYQTILTRSYASLAQYHTGELQNRMTNDTVIIAEGMATIFPNSVAKLIKICGAAIVLLSLDWRFGIIFSIGGSVLLMVTYAFRRVMKILHKQVQEADGNVRSFLQETVGNLLVLRSFGGEEKAIEMSSVRMENHRKERLHRNCVSNVCNVGFGAIMQGGYLFGLIWCCLGILNGTISYGTLIAVLQLVNQIQSPFANMTGYLPKYYAMLASAERLIELEQLPTEEKSRKLNDAQRDELYKNMKTLEIDNLKFAYPGGENILVLEKASAVITKGEFVAITGYSGIGKSTLLKLLLAVYEPVEGELRIITKYGEENKISPQMRPLFAYVPQGNFLLSGTICDVVTFMQAGELDKKRVENACQIACVDFIEKLPNGYYTVIGEKGEGLSEGQVQRLAIARAIYSNAPILLLDESTSALDERTEKKLLKNIRELTDKTVLIVTHRRAALEVCDKIIDICEKRFVLRRN